MSTPDRETSKRNFRDREKVIARVPKNVLGSENTETSEQKRFRIRRSVIVFIIIFLCFNLLIWTDQSYFFDFWKAIFLSIISVVTTLVVTRWLSSGR